MATQKELKRRKNIPAIDQNFSRIIKENMIYADKTEYIHKMLQMPQTYFLARPRRFGKSTLLDTMAELFKGNSELFQDLWIYNSGYQFPKYPVIQLNMAYASSKKTETSLEDHIIKNLRKNAKKYHLSLKGVDNDYESIFQAVVDGLSLKFQSEANLESTPLPEPEIVRNVVILIDEYDAPILDHVNSNLELATRNMETLHNFYRMFKDQKNIYFTFVTGVSQVARAALGQTATNIVDISLLPQYAGICGFSKTDLENLFVDRFEETIANLKSISKLSPSATESEFKDKILNWYDGYNFDGQKLDVKKRVLNPFSIVSLFRDMDFSPYWFDSGPPTFLADFVAKYPKIFITAQDSTYTNKALTKISLSSLDPTALLFQYGYLTLASVKSVGEVSEYTLKIPNLEVTSAFEDVYRQNIFKIESKKMKNELTEKLKAAFVSANSLIIEEILASALSSLTFFQHEPNEKLYHVGLQLFFTGLSLDVRSEVASAWGRSDLDLVFDDNTYVYLELKYELLPEEKEALEPSAQLTALNDRLFETLLNPEPYSIDEVRLLIKDIFPNSSRLSTSLKAYLTPVLSQGEPLTAAQLKDLFSKLDGEFSQKKKSKKLSISSKSKAILNKTAKNAFDQIKDRRYTNHYQLKAKTIVEVGIAIGGRNKVKVIAKKIKG